MDFADFDLKAASERGAWVHLVAPRDGKTGDGVAFEKGAPLFANQATSEGPARVLVKGFADSAVLEAFNRSERLNLLLEHRLARAKDADADSVVAKHQAELKDTMDALVVAAVAAFENISAGGKPLKREPETVLQYFGFGSAFYPQVFEAITDQHRLFTVADSA